MKLHERVADQTDYYFADAFVRKNFAYDYEIVKTFESLQLTPFC